jgi:hypothetical protein
MRRGLASITGCAIGSKGDVVVGLGKSEGRVFWKSDDGEFELTEFRPYRFPAQILDIEVDRSGRFVVALGDSQSGNCGLPAMRGQTLKIWELKGENVPAKRFQVANTCFPNRYIGDIGDFVFRDEIEKWSVGLHGARGVSWHPCEGCRRPGESVEDFIERVRASAEAKIAGAMVDN